MRRFWIALLAVLFASPLVAETPSSTQAPDEASAIGIAQSRGMSIVKSAELENGIWEIKGQNSAGVFLEMRISAADGKIRGMDYGAPSPMRGNTGPK